MAWIFVWQHWDKKLKETGVLSLWRALILKSSGAPPHTPLVGSQRPPDPQLDLVNPLKTSLRTPLTQILKTDCACPYNQPLNYTIDIDDRAPLRKELANTSILSISLSDQKVLCSVETPGKQLPELLGEVFGTFSLVPSAMLIASVVDDFFFWCCSKRCFGPCRPRCCSKACYWPTAYSRILEEDRKSLEMTVTDI